MGEWSTVSGDLGVNVVGIKRIPEEQTVKMKTMLDSREASAWQGLAPGVLVTVPEPAAYTADQVAELLQTSTDRVYQMAREGRIPHVRLGERSIRFPRRAFHAWLDGPDPLTETLGGNRRAEL